MKYILKNKEIELTEEEVKEIVKQNTTPVEEKKVGIAIMSRYGGIKFQSTKTTLKEAVEEGKANLYGANLYGANLYGADLSGANLYGANLSEANLYGANLYGANLSEANLSEANLYGANLYGANLYGADLSEAKMQSVKFYGKGGSTKIKKSQLGDFLKALGIIMED